MYFYHFKIVNSIAEEYCQTSMMGIFCENSSIIDVCQPVLIGTKYSRMDQVKFVEDSLYKI